MPKFNANGFHPGMTVKTLVDNIFSADVLKHYNIKLKHQTGSVHDKIELLRYHLKTNKTIKKSRFCIYVVIHNLEHLCIRNEEA